jgi:dCMP deaminase
MDNVLSEAVRLAIDLANTHSTCRKRGVGAVVIDDVSNYPLLGIGYNRVIDGQKPCCENSNLEDHASWSSAYEIHAEMDAIFSAFERGNSSIGKTLVTTLSPCENCLKHIIRSGISKIYYIEDYHKSREDWRITCQKAQVEVIKIDDRYCSQNLVE